MKYKRRLYQMTKHLVNIIFIGEIVVTLAMPVTVPWLNKNYSHLQGVDIPMLMIYMLIGLISIFVTFQLRKILRTVADGDCFTDANVIRLKKISLGFFLLALMLLLRSILYPTMAIFIELFLFLLAWIFCLVVASVFEEAVRYKEENDLTI
ncbi:MAG: DUF2975 domain-containing protein [Lachnospiraceae bacterium]|nr:DUF2975 domain-containing protein [Lachnospiraceae bacterium]